MGRARFNISLTINTSSKRVGCELYIRHREAKLAFTLLANQKTEVERELGAGLQWQELPHRIASRIVQYRPGDIENRNSWSELSTWFKDRAESFYKTFSPRVKALNLDEDDTEDDQDALSPEAPSE